MLRTAWSEEMSEVFDAFHGNGVAPNAQTIVPPAVISCDKYPCQNSGRCSEYISQDEIDEDTDSWNGLPAGTTKRQRELCWR